MNDKVIYLNPDSPDNWPGKIKTDDFQLFLDYDGTLAPFKNDPAKAYPVKGTNQIINNYLEKDIPVTIVTGRKSMDIRENFIKSEIPVLGLHGREFLPAKKNIPIEIGPDTKNISDKLLNYLNEIVDNNQVVLENKKNAYAIHIKNNKNLQESIYKRINNKVQKLNYNDWEVISGRKIVEVRYKDWNKADAIRKYRNFNILAIYIGDDRTDEDVFENLSEPGLSIYVKNEDKNLNTKADYYLKNPSEVIKLLKVLLDFTR